MLDTKVYIFSAEGFEESETVVPADILRRAGAQVSLISVTGDKTVKGAHGITLVCDGTIDDFSFDGVRMIVLPGGMPGTENLKASVRVQSIIDAAVDKGLYVAAICAAPSILAEKGLLDGRRATCHRSVAKALENSVLLEDEKAVADDIFITGKGMGAAYEFGYKLVEMLFGSYKAEEVKKSING